MSSSYTLLLRDVDMDDITQAIEAISQDDVEVIPYADADYVDDKGLQLSSYNREVAFNGRPDRMEDVALRLKRMFPPEDVLLMRDMQAVL